MQPAWVGALLGALALAGCAADGSGSDTTDPYGSGADVVVRTVSLTSVGGSGLGGTVTLEWKTDSTAVTVSLEGGTSGSTYPAHIHARTCDNAGPIVVGLTSVTMGQTGTGSSKTTVSTTEVESAEEQAGSILVMAHLPDGTPAACVEVAVP